MGYFKVIKHNDNLYQFMDKLGVLATLAIGSKKALLFDTCYGFANLNEEVKKITSKELIVINSHGHMDHTAGNFHFANVYINKQDYELLKEHNGIERRLRNVNEAKRVKAIDDSFDVNRYLNSGEGNINFIEVGEKIDLGDVQAEVISMAGHTKGSIGIFLKEWKIILASDAACAFVWMFLKESTDLKTYIGTLKRTISLDFDYFLVGHDPKLFPKSEMHRYLEVAENLDLRKAFKVDFDGFNDQDAYCYTEGKLYGPGDCGIIFSLDKL